MKLTGHGLRQRVRHRLAFAGNRLARARYFRGHGVHSPFVYNLVREVFMRHKLLPGDRTLYQALLAAGVPERRAVQLQNLAIHCRCHNFGMNCADADLCVMTHDVPLSTTLAVVTDACEAGHTIVVLEPYLDSARAELCRRIVAGHRSTSVDNRAYLLLFNDHFLPKQHFRI